MTLHLDEGRAIFKEEALERLAELEDALLKLEASPEEEAPLAAAFRAVHTIKGSGAMFGFQAIVNFTHEVEAVLDQLRRRQWPLTPELLGLIFQAHDHILAMLSAEASGQETDPQNTARLMVQFQSFLARATTEALPLPGPMPPLVSPEELYAIHFAPAPGIFQRGVNPLLLLDELRALGSCRVEAHPSRIPPFSEFNLELCYTFWEILLKTTAGKNAVQDVFIFVEGEGELWIERLDLAQLPDEASQWQALRQTFHSLKTQGPASPAPISANPPPNASESVAALGGSAFVLPLPQAAPEPASAPLGLASPPLPAFVTPVFAHETPVAPVAKPSEEAPKRLFVERRGKLEMSSIRVSSEKLDKLLNLVGELVTVQAGLSRLALLRQDTELLNKSEEIERLTAELRDQTFSIRMMPIGPVFDKFRRLVRDLAKSLNKEVQLVIEGATTELDKTVLEKLDDPLVHMIRNSLDHGIELPKVRQASGKNPEGTLTLSAQHSGANVLIKIIDDGGGIDPEAIRQRALSQGLIEAETLLSERELLGLIFAPGFSTAPQVTDVSGRGVGMDVVKKNIELLGGTVEITSQKGQGTTMTLKLPLTLAIIEGLLVRVADELYVIPLSMVEECIDLTADVANEAHGRTLAHIRGKLVPYLRLRERFQACGPRPPIEQMVVTVLDEWRVGLVVDEVIGEHQTVIKRLSRVYRQVEGFSGATILGDGTVALILDVYRLLQNVMEEEYRRRNR